MDKLLSVDEVAERLGTSTRFPRRLIAERRIAFVRIGRHVRIAESVLDEFIAAGRVDRHPMARRASGRLMAGRRRFGRVRQLPSGRWQARYPDAGGTLRAAPQTFERKTDAERWLTAVDADISRGIFHDPNAGRLTVGEWAQRWLDAASPHLKIKTRAGYASLLKTKILPRFGDMPLNAVKPIMVSEWVADLRREGFSPSRVRQSYRLLSQIMTAAVANEMISTSPCRGVRLPRMPQTEPHIITREEADRIVAATAPPHDALVMLLAYGGLRIGEAFAVRRKSVDLNAGTIVVAEIVVEIEGRLSLDVPKSHQARVIALPRFVLDRFSELLVQAAADDTLLFSTRGGGLLHYNFWRRAYFDPAVRVAGLTDVTPHDLRASHATWVAQRHGVMAAAARLGHAHASVTTRHYRSKRKSPSPDTDAACRSRPQVARSPA